MKRKKSLTFLKVFMLSFMGLMLTTLYAFIYGPTWFPITIPGHPSVDETRVGFIQELRHKGYIPEKNIVLSIANDAKNLLTIQRKEDYENDKKNVIYLAIGTTIAQGVKKNMEEESRLVFASVTNPVGAGIIENPQTPEGNVTGVSNFLDAYPQLLYFKSIYPSMKKVGFLYNPSEPNSAFIKHNVLAGAARLNMEVAIAEVSDADEVEAAAASLIGKVDAFYENNDNTVAGGWRYLMKVANEHNIPAFTSDTALIPHGALAAYGVDQTEVGTQAAKIVIRLLKGESSKQIPIITVNEPFKVINMDKAKELKIVIPKKVLEGLDRKYPESWWGDFKGWFKGLFK